MTEQVQHENDGMVIYISTKTAGKYAVEHKGATSSQIINISTGKKTLQLAITFLAMTPGKMIN